MIAAAAAAASTSELLGSPLARRPPRHVELPARAGAVAQVEVDQALVRQLGLGGEALEVLDGVVVQADRDRALEALGVRVPLGLGEVVVGSHGVFLSRYCSRSRRLARRAEIMRMTSSSSRWVWTTTRRRTEEL